MKKEISFKDLTVVDRRPGMGEYINYKRQKMRRTDENFDEDLADVLLESLEDYIPLPTDDDMILEDCDYEILQEEYDMLQEADDLLEEAEVLLELISLQGRRSLARKAKRMKVFLRLARKRMKRRLANAKVVGKRAQRRARRELANALAKGKDFRKLPIAMKKWIERRLAQPSFVKRSQIKQVLLRPQVRHDDRQKNIKRKDKGDSNSGSKINSIRADSDKNILQPSNNEVKPKNPKKLKFIKK